MFNKNIVVIVGAGSACEYNMPLGSALAAGIASDVRFRFEHFSDQPMKGDKHLFQILYRHCAGDQEKLSRFTVAGNDLAAAIASTVSIDDALYQLGENAEAVTIGKLGIVRSILKAEAGSSLALSDRNGRLDDDRGRDGWIEQLFSMAITGLKKSELDRAFDKITFVNFNYDRCIEHYLFWSLQRIGLTDKHAEEIVSRLKMIRPYGSVGSVSTKSRQHLQYGASSVDPFHVIPRIRTYTESEALHDRAELEDSLFNAGLILILGFGFHAQNLQLLELSDPNTPTQVMATVKKVHPENLNDISNAVAERLRINRADVELYDMTAPEMLRELRLKITMRS